MQRKADDGINVSPKSGTNSLLEGFVGTDSRAIIQENVYVILGHGRFQESVLLCTILSLTVLILHAFAYRLIGRPVDHWCQPPPHFRDWPVEQWKNVAIPVRADGSLSKCTMYDPPVPDGGVEERHEVPCDRWDYDTADVGDSIVSKWDLVCEHTWLYSISFPVYMLGSMCLVPVAGIMADHVGRRPVILASAATMVFASTAAGSTHAYGVFLLARFAVSAAASAINALNVIVLYEVTGNKHRALYILLATSVAGTVTPALFSLLGPLHPSWRLSHAFLVTASATVLVWCYSLDESPVWQLATWKVRRAERTILQAAKSNGLDLVKVRVTFKALKEQLEKREAAFGTATGSSEGIVFRAYLRRRALSIFLSWFGTLFAYHGARMGRTGLEAHWEVAAHLFKVVLLIAVYYSMKKRGERVTLSTMLALLFVCSVFQTASYEWNLSIAIPVSTVAVFGVTSAAICVNCAYTPEVFPTAVRCVGFCIAFAIGRGGTLLAIFINGFAGSNRVLILGVVMAVLSLVSGVALQWLPEIFIQQTKDTDQGTFDERQRKEALKERLGPLQTAKAGTPGKSRGDRKSKRVPGSPGTSAATSAATSGAASPATATSLQQNPGSPERKLGSPNRKAGTLVKACGSPGSAHKATKAHSQNIGPPHKNAAISRRQD